MYIKDVTLEGFKSYAKRVCVADFDPRFNAITGMNGTGKSNILDAICFVLGISNLSQVRAGSLVDLVYKKGQAGVTEAVVCLTFDNRDKNRSPVGFEDKDTITVTRQVVVGGRNKYRLNGRQVTPAQIHDFFRGVQLNVNQPHFLIMQGRITQVLNMKPPEILAMLEEVAGTRIYEEKRIRAFQTFEKKTQKLKEFDEVMTSDLKPTLQRLKEERNRLLEFNRAQETVATLEHFCIAFEFYSSEKKLESLRQNIQEVQRRKDRTDQEMASTDQQLKAVVEEIKQLEQSIEQQYGAEMLQLQTQSETLAKELTQAEAELQITLREKNNAVDETQKLQQSLGRYADDAMEANLQEKRQNFENAKNTERELEVEVAEIDKEIAQMGDGGEGPSSMFLSEKLEATKLNQLNVRSTLAEMEMKCASAEEKLRDLAKTAQDGSQALHRELQIAQQAVQQTKRRLQELNFDEQRFSELERIQNEKQNAFQTAKDKAKHISRGIGDLDVIFDDPYRGFDRSSVKGIIGSLFRIKQPDTMLALEVAGGSKLRHLVVDTAETANAILKHGRLRHKITIIPLDKIRPDVMPANIRESAAQMFGSNAAPAIDLIDYPAYLERVMHYTFGHVFICKDRETAREMTYHPSIRTRCVTLDGNDYNPSGLLTSGHLSARGSILQPLHELSQARHEAHEMEKECSTLRSQLESQKATMQKYHEYVRELEVQQHSVTTAERKTEEKEAHARRTEAALKEELHQSRQSLIAAQTKLQQLQEQQSELEFQLQNFDGNEGQYVAHLHAKLNALKEKHTQARHDLSAAEQALQVLMAMQTDAHSERQKIQKAIADLTSALQKLENDAVNQQQKIQDAQKRCQAAAASLEEHKAKTRHFDDSRKQMALKKQHQEEKMKQHNSEKRNLTNREGRLELDIVEMENQVEKLMKDEPWIVEQRGQFGREGSAFDWNARNPQEAVHEYKHAKTVIKAIGKRVDPHVVTQFENTQHEYRQLRSKYKCVVKDRKNIEEAIGDLDSKKSESVRIIWEKVSKEFGSIFRTLLPGADARLEPPHGMTYLEGLEVKVALGGVWKHSLSELSGGQRSLLSLSLILSLLLFKPAPFYILDEVDSALDLSHTQNIGHMIQCFFPQSQFIIVSLKEGMFSNANVLFKTMLTESGSAVTRIVPDKQN